MTLPVVIYVLCEPDGTTVRYVGKTTNPRKRYSQHVYSTEKTHRACWIRSLRKRGERPVMRVIETVPDDVSWQEREKYWIAHYREIGANLTNGTDGGDGVVGLSDEARERIIASSIGRPKSPETLEKMRLARRGAKATDEARLHMREAAARRPNPMSFANVREKVSETSRRKAEGARCPDGWTHHQFVEHLKNRYSELRSIVLVKKEVAQKLGVIVSVNQIRLLIRSYIDDLHAEDVAWMQSLHAQGYSYKAIARLFGVSKNTVDKYVHVSDAA